MSQITIGKREVPWLGIGTSGHWGSSAEALEASKLDFNVRQEQLFWNRDDGGNIVYAEQAPMFGNVRNTDDRLLGCVTPQYKIIQNRDAFSLIDPFISGGNGTITHAGMSEDGLCFMVAEVATRLIGGEDYLINLMVTNSFNAKYPCQIIMTPVRIICQNMYRKLIPDRIFLAKHTITANDRLMQIANSGALNKKILMFENIVESAQAKTISSARLKELIAMLFPYPKEKGPRELAYKARADENRQLFEDMFYDAGDNIVHHGSAFGLINAYFDYLSHRGAVRSYASWEDRRLAGIVTGNDVNTHVIKEALK